MSTSTQRVSIADKIRRESDPEVLRGWLDHLDSGEPINRERIPGERTLLERRIAELTRGRG